MMPTHEQIASLAYQLWQQRGCPDGTPEVDWELATRVLEEPPEGDNAIVGFAEAGVEGTASGADDGNGTQTQPRDPDGRGGARPDARKPARRSA